MTLCFDHRDALAREKRDKYKEIVKLQELMLGLAEQTSWPEFLDVLEAGRVAEVGLSDVALAWVGMSVVEQTFESSLRAAFEADDERALKSGDWFFLPKGVFPELARDVYPARIVRLGAHPKHQAETYETARLRRFSAADGAPQMRLFLGSRAALDRAMSGPLVASAVNPASLSTERDSNGMPLDPQPLWEYSADALQRLVDQKVTLAVWPELCGGVERSLSGLRVPAVLTLGSTHTAEGYNEAELFVDGVSRLTYRKIKAFGPPLHPAEQVVSEHINPGSEIKVLYSRTWHVTMVICADINSPSIKYALEAVRANLIFVPSLTSAIGYFETTLTDLSLRNQALIIWSNSPIGNKDVPSSAFFFPWAVGGQTMFTDDGPSMRVHDWRSPS